MLPEALPIPVPGHRRWASVRARTAPRQPSPTSQSVLQWAPWHRHRGQRRLPRGGRGLQGWIRGAAKCTVQGPLRGRATAGSEVGSAPWATGKLAFRGPTGPEAAGEHLPFPASVWPGCPRPAPPHYHHQCIGHGSQHPARRCFTARETLRTDSNSRGEGPPENPRTSRAPREPGEGAPRSRPTPHCADCPGSPTAPAPPLPWQPQCPGFPVPPLPRRLHCPGTPTAPASPLPQHPHCPGSPTAPAPPLPRLRL